MEEIASRVAPLPPQRPREIMLANALPHRARCIDRNDLGAAARPLRNLRSFWGYDEDAAVKALFDPRTAFLDIGFASRSREELSATQFSWTCRQAASCSRGGSVEF
jgi:hypothetical protein